MARGAMYSDWMGYWAFLANRNADQWTRMSQKVRRRRYSPDRMVRDVWCLWSDAWLGWMAVERGEEPPVVVMFEVLKDATTAKKTVGPFFRPSLPVGDPAVVWFGRVDGGARSGRTPPHPLTESSLIVRWRRRDESSLRLLLRVKATPIDVGTYGALVHVADQPLAQVYIKVK